MINLPNLINLCKRYEWFAYFEKTVFKKKCFQNFQKNISQISFDRNLNFKTDSFHSGRKYILADFKKSIWKQN